MTDYQLIDIMCAVTTQLSDLVRKQYAILRQHGLTCEDIDKSIEKADSDLDRIEYALRGDIQ